MIAKLQRPSTYLITNGATTRATTSASEEFARLLAVVEHATNAGVSLIQLREKELSARVLYELTERAARIIQSIGAVTRLLVNDRADIASAAGADGVHLATRSLQPSIVRRTFGDDFLIGVSTHSLAEARAARDDGADFATFGPVFETPSKAVYGAPVGLDVFASVVRALAPFPLVALGGVTLANAGQVFAAGAHGIAAIRLFADARDLREAVREVASIASKA